MTYFDSIDFPKKVHLSGADCFHLVLDKHAKKHEAGGNVMRKIFYFDNCLPVDKIKHVLKSSPLIHWLCNIKLVSGSLFNIPYWQYTDEGRDILVTIHSHPVENEIPEALTQRDIPVDTSRFIECDIVQYPSGSCAFVLSWNHILMDAKGTTLLIKHLNDIAHSREIRFDNLFPAKEKKPNVIGYILNMYKVKRFVQTSSKPPISSVADKGSKSNPDIKFTTISFTIEETAKISTNAFKSGARFGNTLFFIACCSHVINAFNKQKNKKGAFWLPVPYDGRLKGAVGPVISNCVAYLFYRIPQTELVSIGQTVKYLSSEMTKQIKEGMPQKYTMFLNMMRHIPLWLYYFIISHTGRGVFASYLYTSTGENYNDLMTMFGEPIREMAIRPSLTFPPGLTFIFLKHINTLSINIAFSPDVISDEQMDAAGQQLKHFLLADY